MKPKMSREQAMKEVFEEWKAMSHEEFMAKLEAHKHGDIARLLYYAWTGESLPEKAPARSFDDERREWFLMNCTERYRIVNPAERGERRLERRCPRCRKPQEGRFAIEHDRTTDVYWHQDGSPDACEEVTVEAEPVTKI